jgi:hypothetical protein
MMTMTTNQILDDLHNTRRRLLADAGGTIEGLGAALRKRQQASGRRILKTRRTIRCTEAAKSGDSAVENQPSPLGDR